MDNQDIRVAVNMGERKITAIAFIQGTDTWAICAKCGTTSDGDSDKDVGTCPKCGYFVAYMHNVRIVPLTKFGAIVFRVRMWIAGARADKV